MSTRNVVVEVGGVARCIFIAEALTRGDGQGSAIKGASRGDCKFFTQPQPRFTPLHSCCADSMSATYFQFVGVISVVGYRAYSASSFEVDCVTFFDHHCLP